MVLFFVFIDVKVFAEQHHCLHQLFFDALCGNTQFFSNFFVGTVLIVELLQDVAGTWIHGGYYLLHLYDTFLLL